MELYLVWGLRIGIVLLLVGLFWPSKKRKTVLSKLIRRDSLSCSNVEYKGILRYLDRLSEHSLFRPFMIKVGTDAERKLKDKLMKAGLSHIHPNIVQVARVLLPPLGAVLGVGIYVLNKWSAPVVDISSIQEQAEIMSMGGVVNVGGVVSQTSVSSGISPVVVVWILAIALCLYYVPDLIVNQMIKSRRALIKKELPIMEMFIVITLEAGTHTVYEALKTLLDTTEFFRPYLQLCLNEYHVNPQQAIQNMADRVGDEEFQIVCNGLKQAVDTNKEYSAFFMKQHMDQIRRLHQLQKEAKIKKKPILYVFLLALPLINIMVIWFYPWFVKAMRMLSTAL